MNINHYARAKEDDMEKAFTDKGFELVEDTARRTEGKGDKILRCPMLKINLMVDHKCTQNKVTFTINKKEMLDKIEGEARKYQKKEEMKTIPVITFTLKDSPKKYAIVQIDDLCDLVWGDEEF